MKSLTSYFLTAFFFAITLFSFGEGVPVLQYKIVSDTIDELVPEGKCLVYGKITLKENPFKGVKVSSENHLFYNVADENGEYQFFMDAKKIRVYAFQPGYDEVVTNQYEFRSGYRVRIDFYMTENVQMEISFKPVIYLYNPKEMNASIKMNLMGDLTFSYPNYNEGWDVVVKEEGVSLEENRSKIYPYLFWEGETVGLTFQSSKSNFQGYQINTDSTISFLENQCDNLGLNAKEQTDFITFWGPRIQQNPFARIEFLVDEQYDVIGKLNVVPQPDNIRRVYILFQGSDEFDSNLECVQVEIESLSRNGFTVIEWGGTEFSPSKRINP